MKSKVGSCRSGVSGLGFRVEGLQDMRAHGVRFGGGCKKGAREVYGQEVPPPPPPQKKKTEPLVVQ